MSADSDQAYSALRLLQIRARQANLARVGRVADWLDRLDAGGVPEVERLRARDVAHQIVGSAGTFGYPQVSRLASRLEDFFRYGRFDADSRREAWGWVRAIESDLQAEPDAGENGDDW